MASIKTIKRKLTRERQKARKRLLQPIELQCGNKIKYKSFEQARDARFNLFKKAKKCLGPLEVYECPHCNCFHIGHRIQKLT